MNSICFAVEYMQSRSLGQGLRRLSLNSNEKVKAQKQKPLVYNISLLCKHTAPQAPERQLASQEVQGCCSNLLSDFFD